MILRIDEQALAELEEALNWYESRSASAAESFRSVLSNALDRVQSSPASFPTYLFGTKRMILNPFPYSLIFTPEADRVFIVALAHAKRSTDYWSSRLKPK